MSNTTKLLSLTAAVTALVVIFTSCESLWNDTGDGDTGSLTVLLTDDPFPAELVAAANVTIDSLSIREKGGGDGDPFLTLSTDQRTFNLLDLRNGATEGLASLEVPVGEYDLLRLYVGEASIVLDGKTFDLFVPSGAETGIKIFIDPPIQVVGGLTSELLLDIDVSKSFVVKGQPYSGEGITGFTFKPVVWVVNNTAAGSVKGKVTRSSPEIFGRNEVLPYFPLTLTLSPRRGNPRPTKGVPSPDGRRLRRELSRTDRMRGESFPSQLMAPGSSPQAASPLGCFSILPYIKMLAEKDLRFRGNSWKVTDANDAPVAGAQVSAVLDTVISHTFTDSTGTYALIGLLAGTYAVKAYAAGYDTVAVSDVQVTAGNVTSRDFQLTPQ